MLNKPFKTSSMIFVLVFTCTLSHRPLLAAEKIKFALPGNSMGYLPLFVAFHRGFFKDEGIDIEFPRLIPAMAQNALLSGEVQYHGLADSALRLAAKGAPLKAIFYGADRPMYYLVAQKEIRSVADLKGKKIGVSFGGSTFAGTKALLEVYKMNPDKDVQYVSIPGSQPKIAALQQGIIQAALLAPPSDYVALKAGFKRLVNLADVFKDTSFSGLAATGKTIRENPQFVKRMVRAVVRGVIHSRDYPEDAIQTMMKHWHMERDVSVDAYNLVKEALVPVPTEKGVELMAHWQAVALNVQPKRPAREYMDLRFVKEVMAELGQKQ
jgi:ABC-type nitrate/sulfonate/bicarbonate transport system substrate-binding protein